MTAKCPATVPNLIWYGGGIREIAKQCVYGGAHRVVRLGSGEHHALAAHRKEGIRSTLAARGDGLLILGRDFLREFAALQTFVESANIKAYLLRYDWQLIQIKAVVRRGHFVDFVYIAPEGRVAALVCRALGSLRLLRRLGVYLRKREVAENPCDIALIPVVVHYLVHCYVEILTEATLKVGVLDYLNRGIRIAQNMVLPGRICAHTLRVASGVPTGAALAGPKNCACDKCSRDHDNYRQNIILVHMSLFYKAFYQRNSLD
ncbi:MAG: hypothetical protein UY86_C0001G0052 [Candidatus Adlerbacteria bacterium GW2011_GWB1_54_7]|uniref:Uncharacterized protein n=1 Tax=Candidatus Adlerbacteria bacterium GW2011_GWB1_54_7 TaxID=1618607 RepID=A0A0G2AYL6_9BACT|nr:MAG: hypothetical protein UY86_C0001G0052 [Candidatus Adlerbacteria bacterium GW2011_GWB1_54_7]